MASMTRSLADVLASFEGDYSTLFTPRRGNLMHSQDKGWSISRMNIPKKSQAQYFDALSQALAGESTDDIVNPVGLALRVNELFQQKIICSYEPNMGNRIGFKFKDKNYSFLSNLYPTIVVAKGKFYSSSETAYKSNKPVPEDHKSDLIQEDTDELEEETLALMRDVVKAKFACNSMLRDALLKTSPHDLVENTTHEFWGLGQTGQGANHLGKILMDCRSIWLEEQSKLNS